MSEQINPCKVCGKEPDTDNYGWYRCKLCNKEQFGISNWNSANPPQLQAKADGVCCEQWKRFGDVVYPAFIVWLKITKGCAKYPPFNFCPWCGGQVPKKLK